MTIAQVLQNRDRNIIFEIQTLLAKILSADDKKRVSAELTTALDRADVMWQEDLATVLGPEKAAKLVAQLKSHRLVDD